MKFENVSKARSSNLRAIRSISKLEDEISKLLWQKELDIDEM